MWTLRQIIILLSLTDYFKLNIKHTSYGYAYPINETKLQNFDFFELIVSAFYLNNLRMGSI